VHGAGLDGATALLRIPLDGASTSTLGSWTEKEGVARAPIVVSDGARLVTGTLAIAAGSQRTLRVSDLHDGQLAPLGEIAQGLDESEANAILAVPKGALVAWDDADATRASGRIRLAIVTAGTKIAAPATSGTCAKAKPPEQKPSLEEKDAGASPEPRPLDVISPESSDASWPILVPAPDGTHAFLLWLAERPDAQDDDDASAGEPSQLEAFRWVEAVTIELATGRALGAPQLLTSRDGHAQTYAAAVIDGALVVAVRDDERPTDAEGGSLVAARATFDPTTFAIGTATISTLAGDDMAPGVPFVFSLPAGKSPLVAYLTAAGTTRIVPIAPADAQVPATLEPSLAGMNVVTSRADRLLASKLVGAAIELSVARCEP
jgi:hypothetical protein